MKQIFLTASVAAMLTATAAIAQDMPAPAPTEPAMPPPEATMPPATPPESAAPAAPAPEAGAPPAASPEAAAAAMPAEAAQTPAEWAKYDRGGKGYLTALEFGTWVMAKQGNDVGDAVEKTRTSKKSDLPAVKVLNATGSMFLKADKNGDRHITPDELAGYVAG